MDTRQLLAMALDPGAILRARGFAVDRCSGLLGIPMRDAQAKLLESLLHALPSEDRVLTRAVTPKPPTEVMDGERADVSWITTEEIDREGEVVIALGMTDAPVISLGPRIFRRRIGLAFGEAGGNKVASVGMSATGPFRERIVILLHFGQQGPEFHKRLKPPHWPGRCKWCASRNVVRWFWQCPQGHAAIKSNSVAADSSRRFATAQGTCVHTRLTRPWNHNGGSAVHSFIVPNGLICYRSCSANIGWHNNCCPAPEATSPHCLSVRGERKPEEPMRYRVLACDYDGTLARDGQVDTETLEALKRFTATGRALLLVSGRELDQLISIFPEIALCARVVAENGAVLYRPASKEVKVLGKPPPENFVPALKARGVDSISAGRVIVATWRPHETKVLQTIRDLRLEMQVVFNKDAVMVLPSGVNKATGLTAALEELGITAHETVGVGDAENDQSFLSLCELSAAVANALPAIKDAVDIVLQRDHGAGVAELIDQLMTNSPLKADLA